MPKIIFLIFVLFLINTHLYPSEMEIPQWMFFDLSIKGNLKIGISDKTSDNWLQIHIKCPVSSLKNCEIEPYSKKKSIYFYPVVKNTLNIQKNKDYILNLKFKILDNIDNVPIGIKFKAVYPVNEIIELLKKNYPDDSPKRQEKIDYLFSKTGKTAIFETYINIGANKKYSYTSKTGVVPFDLTKTDGVDIFTISHKDGLDSIDKINKEIKEKIGYSELLKDSSIKDTISNDPVSERRNILKKLFNLKFDKILYHFLKEKKEISSDIDSFINKFVRSRITDVYLWRKVVCVYLYLAFKNKKQKINRAIKKFIELKINDWDLSFLYYNYAVYLHYIKKNNDLSKEFVEIAYKINPYLHIAEKLKKLVSK